MQNFQPIPPGEGPGQHAQPLEVYQKAALTSAFLGTRLALSNRRGENFIDSGFKVLIVVVLAAVLLAGLYLLFADLIMPMLDERVTELFNYTGP